MAEDTRNWQINMVDPAAVVEGMEDIAQCVYIVLTTIKGSDPLRVGFGSDLYQYLDKPLSQAQPLLIYSVNEALKKWEKRIAVTKCRLQQSEIGKSTLLIEAVIIASAAQVQITINI